MRTLKSLGLCLICFCLCSVAVAQTKAPLNEPDQNKPKLFADMPDQIAIEITQLKSLVTANNETGKNVAISFADKKIASLSGKVVSADSKYNNTIQSVNIRLSNFSAMLTLSSFTEPDGTVSYSGRIISFSHGDAYELQKKADQYILVKKNFNEIVNE